MKKYCIALSILLTSFILCGTEKYSVGNTTLEFDCNRKSFTLDIAGAPSLFKIDRLWEIHFFDEAAKKANFSSADGLKIGCNERFVQSKTVLDYARARFLSSSFDKENGLFSAKYQHPDADVTVYVKLQSDGAQLQLEVVNRSSLPINSIYPFPALAFELNKRKFIVPQPYFNGIEADACRDHYFWSSSSAWNGILIPSVNQSLFALDVFLDRSRLSDQTLCEIFGDSQTGQKLIFKSEYICYLNKNESRRSPVIQLRNFPNLRSWADSYISNVFPDGTKKLSQKYSSDIWEKIRQGFWVTGEGKFSELTKVIGNIPGKIIFQNGEFMHPLKGSGATRQLDSFPNYFPVNPLWGTDAQFEELIKTVAANGGIYVPRTTFFYWVKGSDFDLEHDLQKSAMVSIGGKPRTAQWGSMPGYIVSPFDKNVRAFMAATANKFKLLGATGYFTNVICAINAISIRYDFHPSAPAPDALYAEITELFRKHGENTPLFSEGRGGHQLLPWQAGICYESNYNRDDPKNISPNAKSFENAKLSWAPALMLWHEYVINLPHNLGGKDATSTINRLTHSLLNGFMLKSSIAPQTDMTHSNLLWLRSCAILSQEVSSLIRGKRLLDYHEENGIATADYAGNTVKANFSDTPMPWSNAGNSGFIAPDGFSFSGNDHNVVAGYFSELNGIKYANPLLLLAVKDKADKIKLYTPLEFKKVDVIWNGVKVEIPAYPPYMEKTVRGVTLMSDGKIIADPAGSGFLLKEGKTGFDTMPSPSRDGSVPLQIDWDHTRPLPAQLELTAPASVDAEGIKLVGKSGCVMLKTPHYYKRFYAEMVIRYDRMPGFPDLIGFAPFASVVLPPGTYYYHNRTVEFGYNLQKEKFAGYVSGKSKRYGASIKGIKIEPGKFYHVRLMVGNGKLSLTVNGQEAVSDFEEFMRPTPTQWRFGGLFDHMTISMIRFGGE